MINWKRKRRTNIGRILWNQKQKKGNTVTFHHPWRDAKKNPSRCPMRLSRTVDSESDNTNDVDNDDFVNERRPIRAASNRRLTDKSRPAGPVGGQKEKREARAAGRRQSQPVVHCVFAFYFLAPFGRKVSCDLRTEGKENWSNKNNEKELETEKKVSK